MLPEHLLMFFNHYNELKTQRIIKKKDDGVYVFDIVSPVFCLVGCVGNVSVVAKDSSNASLLK